MCNQVTIHSCTPSCYRRYYFSYAQHPLLIPQHFAEIISVTSKYSAMYTDGSKDDDMIPSGSVFGQQVYSRRLPSSV